ncbi:MAG: MFS transporter [Dehalococcoidia bacterium]|nr:MFS transporter [Dehalococcoidia bacterium]
MPGSDPLHPPAPAVNAGGAAPPGIAARGSRRLRAAARAPFGGVPGPFHARHRDTDFDEHVTPLQERAMRAFWWDGFWASGSETVVLNYLGLYLLAFGASNAQVGLLSSFSSLFAALAFFPGAHVAETVGHRKATVLASGGGLARLALVALALVPFFARGGAAIWLVMAIASFRGFFAYFHVPAWTSLTSDIVPAGIRGRYLASRNIGMSICALAVAPLAGFLIDQYTGFHGWQLVWMVAFATGALSTWAYARIPEPPPHPPAAVSAAEPAERGFFGDLLADRNFVAYLASVAIWNLALQVSGPFFNVYLVKNLHASSLWVGILAALPSLSALVGLLYMGRMMDRRGTKSLMVVCGLLIPLLPLAWTLVNAPWQVIFINAFGGALWAGYNLALSNMVMVMSPPEKRARYAAAFQTVMLAAAFAGPLLGGYVIDATGFRAVFLLSAGGRLAAALVLLKFVAAKAPEPLRRPAASPVPA